MPIKSNEKKAKIKSLWLFPAQSKCLCGHSQQSHVAGKSVVGPEKQTDLFELSRNLLKLAKAGTGISLTAV